MIQRRMVSGEVVSVGQSLQQGGPGHAHLVDSLVIKIESGSIVQLRDIVVPGSLHWMLKAGHGGTFDIAYVRYPKPFGTYLRCFLVGAQTQDGKVDAISEVQNWIQASKAGALHFFWIGLIFMPAFGMGLLFWVCAWRLLNIEKPSTIGPNS